MKTKTLICLLSCALWLGSAILAQAADFTVTTTNRTGAGSLSQALWLAQSSSGTDLITFSNVAGTIDLEGGYSLADVTLSGPGASNLTVMVDNVVVPSGSVASIHRLRFAPNRALCISLTNAGTLYLTDCEFAGFYTSCDLSPIVNGGMLHMTGCTLANNTTYGSGSYYFPGSATPGRGGALKLTGGNAWVTNCTFSANRAERIFEFPGEGGAVYAQAGIGMFVNCTFTENTAELGPALFNRNGQVVLMNCLVTDPMVGAVSESGGNLFIDARMARLTPLDYHGSSTRTHALLPNSPAIGIGLSAQAPPTDQCGVARPQGTAVDCGAIEFEIPAGYWELVAGIEAPGLMARSVHDRIVTNGAVVELGVEVPNGYHLAEWTGNASGRDNPLRVLVDGHKNILGRVRPGGPGMTNGLSGTNVVINTSSAGPGSLRQALLDTVAAGGGAIVFSNVSGQIIAEYGLPFIPANVHIRGPGADRLALYFPPGVGGFDFGMHSTSSLSGLSVTSPQRSPRWGGAVSNAGNLALRRARFLACAATNGGAVFNSGALNVEDCLFAENWAESGGAIYNVGSACLARTILAQNTNYVITNGASQGGAGFYHATGALQMVSCTVTGNVAKPGRSATYGPGLSTAGAGVFIVSGGAVLRETLVAGNQGTGGEGGGYLGSYGSDGGGAHGLGMYVRSGSLSMTNCAINNNTGKGGDGRGGAREIGPGGMAAGGGLYISTGEVVLANCTFSGNLIRSGETPEGSPGGAVSNPTDAWGGAVAVSAGSVHFVHCTITGNYAYGGAGLANYGTNLFSDGLGPGIWIGRYGSNRVALLNCIVSGNTGSTGNDIDGVWESAGPNLVGGYAALGPLQDNGGPTPSHALLISSPAIDAASTTALSFDQRGQPRPVDYPPAINFTGGSGADLGAVEMNHLLTLTGIRCVDSNILIGFTTVSDRSYGLAVFATAPRREEVVLPQIWAGSGGIVTAPVAMTNRQQFYRVFRRD